MGIARTFFMPEYTAIGIGVVCRNDGRIWATEMFGMPLDVYLNGEPSLSPAEPIVRKDSGLSC